MRIGSGPKAALVATALAGALLVSRSGAAEPRADASTTASPTATASATTAAAASAEEAGERLGEAIERGLRAEGPFFTEAERAVIERACGYAPGQWDGFDVNMDDDALICADGRRADGAELRAVLRAAGPRIEARVARMMASPEVAGAIARIAEQAAAEATRGIELAMAGLEDGLDIDVDVDPGDGTDVDIDLDVDADDDDEADSNPDPDPDPTPAASTEAGPAPAGARLGPVHVRFAPAAGARGSRSARK